ncbi:transposase DDE domain protein, partial [Leptospira borgpetersenii str. Brem 307]
LQRYRSINQKKKHSISYSKKGEKPLIGKYKGKSRRWVVERTNSWHNRFRAILIRWERKPENYLASLYLASSIIAFNFFDR